MYNMPLTNIKQIPPFFYKPHVIKIQIKTIHILNGYEATKTFLKYFDLPYPFLSNINCDINTERKWKTVKNANSYPKTKPDLV